MPVSLERICSRSVELSRAVAIIDAATAEAGKDARTLQLECTLEALAKATTAIEASKRIERTSSFPDGRLLGNLDASADAIAAVAKVIGQQHAIVP